MTIKNEQYQVLIADEGKFLANSDMTLYGTTIVLGDTDSPSNYTEHPIEEMPQPTEPEPEPEPEPEQ